MTSWKYTPKGKGILVAVDEKAEWLLPWWYRRYSQSNQFPVAFVDLGMTHYGKTFCEERGEVIPLDAPDFLSHCPVYAEEWESIFGKTIWENRKSWGKKPFAFLVTPFEKTLWLDLDCEVLSSLEPLFDQEANLLLAKETEAALEKERKLKTIQEDQMLYNSGVILYSHGEPLMEKWAKAALKEGEQFWSDQHTLSHIIYQEKIPIEELHKNYNWRMSQGLNIHAVIIHWSGTWGKEYIRRYAGIGDRIAKLPPV